MADNKRLFLCECVCSTAGGIMTSSAEIYVVSTDPTRAEQLAIQWMRNAKWKYDDYVRKVVCVASEDQHRSDLPLIT